MQPEFVGILLNAKMHRGIEAGLTHQEYLPFYEKFAAEYGISPCYLKIEDIDLSRGISRVYVQDKGSFVKKILKTPSIIHNRAIYRSSNAARKIGRLQQQGVTVFNSNNRYGKDQIYRLLAEHPRLSRIQPYSLSATSANTAWMMQHYDDLLLKPVNSSVGRGIMRLLKSQTGWKLLYRPASSGKQWKEIRVSETAPLPKAALRLLAKDAYLVQERLPLAETDGRPFDFRVSVQRGLNGQWGITGVFGKLSAPGSFLSNIAQGAAALPARELLASVFPGPAAAAVLASLQSFAMETARYLSWHLPLLADLGMDFGVTASGQVYFIECNGRDQRYGFRKAGMEEEWAATYRHPMAFARHLLLKQQL